jgi:hypothetical protein
MMQIIRMATIYYSISHGKVIINDIVFFESEEH